MSHRPANRGAVGPAPPPKHSRLAAYPRPTAGGAPAAQLVPPVGVSASVGHDHWANDVLNVVAGPGSSQGSNSPGSSRSEGGPRSPSDHEDGASSAGLNSGHSDSELVSVERRVVEKKRKFHTGRQLELKNLPDGCTEQVQTTLL